MSTLVTWAFAPTWLSLEEAAELSGYNVSVLRELVAEGTLDTQQVGLTALIGKASLREYQEARLDWRAVQIGAQVDA